MGSAAIIVKDSDLCIADPQLIWIGEMRRAPDRMAVNDIARTRFPLIIPGGHDILLTLLLFPYRLLTDKESMTTSDALLSLRNCEILTALMDVSTFSSEAHRREEGAKGADDKDKEDARGGTDDFVHDGVAGVLHFGRCQVGGLDLSFLRLCADGVCCGRGSRSIAGTDLASVHTRRSGA